MPTGEIKNPIDRTWDAFWSGGISNPQVIEQFTCLLYLRRLGDRQTLERTRATTLSSPATTSAGPAWPGLAA